MAAYNTYLETHPFAVPVMCKIATVHNLNPYGPYNIRDEALDDWHYPYALFDAINEQNKMDLVNGKRAHGQLLFVHRLTQDIGALMVDRDSRNAHMHIITDIQRDTSYKLCDVVCAPLGPGECAVYLHNEQIKYGARGGHFTTTELLPSELLSVRQNSNVILVVRNL